MAIRDGRFYPFKYISQKSIDKLNATSDRAGLRQIFMNLFQLKGESLRDEILIDFHQNNYLFAKKHGFDSRKTSTFMSIFIKVFNKAMKHRMENDEAFALFKTLVLNHSVERPPYSVVVFYIDDLKEIVDFALGTFFRNFSLYKYTYTPHLDMVISHVFKGASKIALEEEGEVQFDLEPADAEVKSTVDDQAPEATEESQDTPVKDEQAEDPIKKFINDEVAKMMQTMQENMKKQDEAFMLRLEEMSAKK